MSQRPVICFPTTPYFFSWQTEGLLSSCTITRSFSVSCSPQRLLLFLPATSTFLPRQYTCSLPRTCYLLAHRMIVLCLHRDTSFDVQQLPPHTITPIRTPSSQSLASYNIQALNAILFTIRISILSPLISRPPNAFFYHHMPTALYLILPTPSQQL